MRILEFWSADRRFGLRISEMQVSAILGMCARAMPNETGGLLVGFYNETRDCAVVTNVSGAPQDSRAGRTWFYRGFANLQKWLDHLWKRKRYYVGEWHFHPGGTPAPSNTDIQQMESTALSSYYQCPEPIMLIVGGSPPSDNELATYVFPRGRQMIVMRRACHSISDNVSGLS